MRSAVSRLWIAVVAGGLLVAPAAATTEPGRWAERAAHVTIVRDDWGIAHVTGATDADAVFGAMYAQAEDDFHRIEVNYLTALGRTAEADGETALAADLRQRMFVDPADLRAKYAASPDWLRRLMDAWADGLNAYLARHPAVHPAVLTHFEPWMALSFTEGSIGGDIERISLPELRAFYGDAPTPVAYDDVATRFPEPSGSNGIAIAPQNTRDGHTLFLINPHTSFFFRSELHVTSGEGLNAYGAATWGQFFIYQGFNEHAGWMHTSSGVDNVDFFAETIARRAGRITYRYGSEQRPVRAAPVTIAYRTPAGGRAARTFTVYRTHHGPIVRGSGNTWISVGLMYKPVEALEQSFLRTKSVDYAGFRRVAELRANSSNNTVFADAGGEIAYLHPQFIPRRDDRFDYTHVVDGADPATDWHGEHALDDAPHVVAPASGWIANSNNWPYSVAGTDSPKRDDFPRYMDVAGENQRGIHAHLMLDGRTGFTLESLVTTAFDPFMPGFAELVPRLVAAYDALPDADAQKARYAAPIAALRAWDNRWSTASVPTALAMLWGEALVALPHPPESAYAIWDRLRAATPQQLLAAFGTSLDRATADFGTWRTPWGEINRFQRLTDAIAPQFDDAAVSIPVGFTSSLWGSLAAFGTTHRTTKKHYGTSGNSFDAVVEFGPRVRAKAVTAGGESGAPGSPHFDDQATRYSTGNLRDVYFYPEQIAAHATMRYHPGAAAASR